MKVLVIGCGKSGTTIVAETIHNSIPGSTFIMEPRSLQAFKPVDGPMVVKVLYEDAYDNNFLTELVANATPIKFDKIITIVRDPRDVLISKLYYTVFNSIIEGKVKVAALAPWLKLLDKKERDPQSVSVQEMIELTHEVMGSPIVSFERAGVQRMYGLSVDFKHGFMLQYESFVDGDVNQLEEYLGLNLIQTRDVSIGHRRVVRTKGYGSWKTHFTPSDVEQYKKLHVDLLSKMGYNDWDIEIVDHLDPNQGSRYVMSLVANAQYENKQKKISKTIKHAVELL